MASPAGRLAKLCDFGISCKVCFCLDDHDNILVAYPPGAQTSMRSHSRVVLRAFYVVDNLCFKHRDEKARTFALYGCADAAVVLPPLHPLQGYIRVWCFLLRAGFKPSELNSTQLCFVVHGVHAWLLSFSLSVVVAQVPDVRFYKQTGDINKIPWSGLFGTGGYIAPEIMSQHPFGKPADLW